MTTATGLRATTSLRSSRFRALIGMVLFIMMGFGLIIPALPRFVRAFDVREAGVGLLLAAFAATRLAGDMVAASFIDRWGERTMAALGAAIVGVSSAAAGAAPSFAWLVIFRGAGGIGSAFFLGALTSYVIGTVPQQERGRASGVFQAAIGIGITVGPLFGGLLSAISLRLPLYVYGFVCLATAPMCLAVLRGRGDPATVTLATVPGLAEECPVPRAPAWSRLRPLLNDSAYRASLMASASDFWVSSALFTLLTLLWVERLHLPQSSTGVPLTALGVAAAIVFWHAGSLSDRRGRKVALVPALLVTSVTLALLGYASTRWEVLALMAFLGFSSAYSRPGATSIVGDVATDDQRAVAVSGYRTAGDLGALLAPIVAGSVAQSFGYRWAFAATAVFVFVAFLFALAARETLPEPAQNAA